MRPIVIVESPFKPTALHSLRRHVQYARCAMLDCIERGETPLASHLLYPQVLDDGLPEHRALGIAMGLDVRRFADRAVFYVDFGWSEGMKAAKGLYDAEGKPYEERSFSLERFGELLTRVGMVQSWDR